MAEEVHDQLVPIMKHKPAGKTNVVLLDTVDYGNGYNKVDLDTLDSIVEYFSQIPQMKLFPIDNSKAIQTMMFENKGTDIIFVPNITKDCNIPDSYYGSSRINILSFNQSKYNLKYASICKKSNGVFLTI